MSKWIDAEWIRNMYADFEHYENRDDWTTPITNVLAVIDDAPSIDIVRCKECKWLRYCETEDLDLYLDCDKPDGGGIPQNEDWFCADGERKESE